MAHGSQEHANKAVEGTLILRAPHRWRSAYGSTSPMDAARRWPLLVHLDLPYENTKQNSM
jgi:hypothetical protein